MGFESLRNDVISLFILLFFKIMLWHDVGIFNAYLFICVYYENKLYIYLCKLKLTT